MWSPLSDHIFVSTRSLKMKVLGAVLSALLLQIAKSSDDHYEVPEPVFDVYVPKGLRISLPDSRDVKSVEFVVNLPTCPEPLIQEVNHTTGGNWVYWNPDVALRLYDKLRYRMMVQRKDAYWKKEGTHIVKRVSSLTNETDCTENQGQKVIAGFSGLEERNKGMINTGKASNFKSSYSTLKSSELKPITKSSMSTTSGTFFIKPSGVMEATGYKKGSSFDSTKREGEQWEHYQSELTADELENMKNLYGSGFHDFPHLPGNLFPSAAKMYEKSYMSSESKSFPSTIHSLGYAQTQPLTTHKFHETHQTHETSSFSRSKPVFQFTDSSGGSSFTQSNAQSEKHYRMEPLISLPNPLPPQGTIVKATEYVRQEHTIPVAEVSSVHVDRVNHRNSPPQKLVQVSQSGEFSSHNQEVMKPVYTPEVAISGEQRRADQLEYTSGNLHTVERQDFGSRRYLGNIFTSVKTSKVRSPQECSLVPGVDYAETGNVRNLEKRLHELSCLATLAESTTKEEFALLKQKNSELNRKIELLEHEVKRISSACNCYE